MDDSKEIHAKIHSTIKLLKKESNERKLTPCLYRNTILMKRDLYSETNIARRTCTQQKQFSGTHRKLRIIDPTKTPFRNEEI